MASKTQPDVEVTADLIEAIRAYPLEREVEHCGTRFAASAFETYADCPRCGSRIKIRSFSGVREIEDVFDAVFEWMNQPAAEALAARRRALLRDED